MFIFPNKQIKRYAKLSFPFLKSKYYLRFTFSIGFTVLPVKTLKE